MTLLAELRWSPSETGQVISAKNADSHPGSLLGTWEENSESAKGHAWVVARGIRTGSHD